MSFRIAIVIALILAGVISEGAEATEPSVNNSQVVHERLVSNQEFNSLNENDQLVILSKAEGSSVTPPTRGSQPSNFPSGTTGHVNPYRIPPKVAGQGLGGWCSWWRRSC